MVFHSPNFLIFFLILLIPYFLFKKKRLAVLAIGNVWFYASSGLGVFALFALVTLIVYAVVHLMRRPGWGWTFWLGIAVVVGNLVFFKYTLFVLDSLSALVGRSFAGTESAFIAAVGRLLGSTPPTAIGGTSSYIIPVGISFYTFQFLAYIIDIRRGREEPTRSLLKLWVFISFFPQLVAGPIMRGNELMPELEQAPRRPIRWQEIKYGVYLFGIGLFKKIVLADPLGHLANGFFDQAAKGAISPADAWAGAYLFGFQIYFDFSAYSDMAMGLGFIMGIRIIRNFDTPYLSASVTEFWRRWHISLSRWIKDYIYIGLGGNRKGRIRTQVNLFAAMAISGLWHGADWKFVLWGALHGALLIGHKWSLALNRWAWIERLRRTRVYHALAIIVFLQIVMWTWVFFRAANLHTALRMTRSMLHVTVPEIVNQPYAWMILGLFALHVLEYVMRHYESRASRVWHWVPFPVRGAVYFAVYVLLIYCAKGSTYEFIYFQF